MACKEQMNSRNWYMLVIYYKSRHLDVLLALLLVSLALRWQAKYYLLYSYFLTLLGYFLWPQMNKPKENAWIWTRNLTRNVGSIVGLLDCVMSFALDLCLLIYYHQLLSFFIHKEHKACLRAISQTVLSMIILMTLNI